ncbi:hypothetical protein OCK74_09535 [Chitinophagaceae bacterium LB-8]|uniref:DUF4412 domain-containing protein n=1 Tax=Paraflavisolibacter caeni TaxID=2982496 RepID=A0A9X2XV85_9BACT|nr:hypothetical protein [Paraflavisolibacter caeni]MCU7549355.1 hypothetical protein [Paraflavisolibacter caeni]
MKNTIFMAITALFVTASAQAQQPTTNIDSTRRGTTVDSIRAKYKMQPMPEAMSTERVFPALGTYQLNNATDPAASTVTVTMDSASRGIVWVEGLPQGRIKAYLKKSPSTYRILSQKTASGTQVPEGTLFYDSTAHQLNVALGVPYNEADPTSVFTALNTTTQPAGEPTDVKIKTKDTKVKTKAKYYTATKQMPMTQPGLNATDSLQNQGVQTQDTLNQSGQQPQQPQKPQQP